jgi:hypothetical protein
MSDDDKEKEVVQNWDAGNTNVVAPGVMDQPAVVLDHPEFMPDMSMVGVENPVGTPSEEHIKTMDRNFGRTSGQMLDPGGAQGPGPTTNTALTAGQLASQYPSLRQHGFSAPGNHITASLNYYTIYTTIDITPTGIGQMVIPNGTPPGVYNDVVSNSQLMLDKLIETISLRAQPIVMSQITSVAFGSFVAVDTTFVPTAGTVWSMSFAIDKNGAWDTLQTGWVNSLNPVGGTRFAIQGGPNPYAASPDLTGTIGSNLNFMAPPFINDGNSAHAATNTFVVVSSGPF